MQNNQIIVIIMSLSRINRVIDGYMNNLIKYQAARWSLTMIALLYLFYRTVSHGYIGVMYFSGLYLLYLAVQFFTPMGLPDPDQDDYNTYVEIPFTMKSNDRPVVRSITEFNLWKKGTIIILVAILCTYSAFFLIPVYWPFLLIYFLILIFFSMKKHIKHMRKYGYNIGDFTKKHVDTF